MAKRKKKAKAKPTAIKKRPRKVAKKTPARTVKPSGRKPTTRRATTKEPARKKLPKKPRRVKAPSKPLRTPRRSRVKAPPAPRRPKLSQHPDAVRARRYRREKKAIAEALEVERQERLERRRERDRERRKRQKGIISGPASPSQLARGWLEAIRDHCAELVPTSLEVTTEDPHTRGVWIAVGRYDFHEPVSYLGLGDILEHVLADDILSARINPNRLTQIRVLFVDPNARERSGPGSYLSKISAWEFALGDLIGEVLGGGASDEMSLAVRYDSSRIPAMYVYFSSETKIYTTASAFMQRTATVPTK